MPTNDILPFATGGGANVETQAVYVSDPTTATGFQSGIAPSLKLNKVWRQSSFISAMLAQFIVDKSAQSVLDDGDIAGLEVKLTAAINAVTAALLGGSNQSLVTNGYQKLPGGLVLQWGQGTAGQNGTAFTNTYPIAFPNNALIVLAMHIGTDPSVNIVADLTVGITNATQFALRSNYVPGNVAAIWFALGK